MVPKFHILQGTGENNWWWWWQRQGESHCLSSFSDQKWCPIKWQWNSHGILFLQTDIHPTKSCCSLQDSVWASKLMLTAFLCSSGTWEDKNRCAPKHPSLQEIFDLHPCLRKVFIPFVSLFSKWFYSFWLVIRPCFNNSWAAVFPAEQRGGLCTSETFSGGQHTKGHRPVGEIHGPWAAGLLPSSSFPAYLCAHAIAGHSPSLLPLYYHYYFFECQNERW